MTAVQVLLSLSVPLLTRRFGNGILVSVGLALVVAGLAWLTRSPPTPGT